MADGDDTFPDIQSTESRLHQGVPSSQMPARPMRRNLDFVYGKEGFSKKLGNHEHAIALYYMHYNFCRIHQSLRGDSGNGSGINGPVWSLGVISLWPKINADVFRQFGIGDKLHTPISRRELRF
jgi:hypothetical protein